VTGPLAVGPSARDSLTAVMAELQASEFATLRRAVEAFVGAAGAGTGDPSAAEAQLIEAGLSFLVDLLEPLHRCRAQVDGDAGALEAKAAEWGSLARRLRGTVPAVEDLSRAARRDWSGQASDAFATTMAEFTETVAGASAAADGVTLLLRMCAELMAAARTLIDRLIDELVEYMIVAEAAAAASAVLTMGASEGAALSAIVGRVADGVERAIDVVEHAAVLLERIAGALREIGAVFGRVDHLLARLGRLAGAARGSSGPAPTQPAAEPNEEEPR